MKTKIFFGSIFLVLSLLSTIPLMAAEEPERYICDELSWLLDSQVENGEKTQREAEAHLSRCYNVFRE